MGVTRARLGAHMSIEGGLPRAIDRAESVGATALQVFVRSARQWTARPIDAVEVRAFRRRLREAGLARHTLAHASYLINLASGNDALRERSIGALRDELRRCETLGIPYLVVHPGAHTGQGVDAGLRTVIDAVDTALDFAPVRKAGRRTRLLLETTAGQGSSLGNRFDHLGRILDGSRRRRRLGICFDTCHAFAAGYDFRDRASYRATFDAVDREVGLDRLYAFHLNDSKKPLGSRRDRHEHVGLGEVGLDAFRLLLADRRFDDLPMVLETPKGEDLQEDRDNLERLRSLLPRSRR